MTAAVCAGDGDGTPACFTPAGIYHDGFYGEFKGRREIGRMVRELFHRDARDFAWRIHDAVSGGRVGSARYDFLTYRAWPAAKGAVPVSPVSAFASWACNPYNGARR